MKGLNQKQKIALKSVLNPIQQFGIYLFKFNTTFQNDNLLDVSQAKRG